MDLPDDFVERATEITDVHAANPVKAELAGGSSLFQAVRLEEY